MVRQAVSAPVFQTTRRLNDVRLIELVDEDFDWMRGGAGTTRNGLRLPTEGVDEPEIVEHVRRIAARLRQGGSRASWMMVVDDEVVGLCGHKDLPSKAGEVEIGYSVAPSRRRQGFATRAVAEMLRDAKADAAIRVVKAETTVANLASHRVLEVNGFIRVGARLDDEDGALDLWESDCGRFAFA